MNTLVDLLHESASRFPTRDAYLFKPGFRTQRWNFSQVWEDSGRVAGCLSQHGVTKGDRVVIWGPNRPEWVLALYGCLRLGAVAVPLDVRSALDFVEQVVAQTRPKVAFVSHFTSFDFPLGETTCLDLDNLRQTISASLTDTSGVSLTGDDLAEVMFTSGTTGSPKGVMLTHGNILSNVQATDCILPEGAELRLLSLLPLSHMLEQTGGLFGAIHRGCPMAYPISRQPSILLKTMREYGITTMLVVPQVLQLFMNAIERQVASSGKEQFWAKLLEVAGHLPMEGRRLLFRSVLARFGGDLRYLVCGGAYLDPALGEKWERLGVMVLQGYGATETSPGISSNTHRMHRLDSLGRVLSGQEVRINPDGEILVHGPNVTQGYWNNPKATTDSFEDGWYKTGDLGSVDEQGFLYFRGRKKDLIVLANGQNVYPEDLENLLRKQPGVQDAAVVGLTKEGGDVEVHAVLLLKEDGEAQAVVRAVNNQVAAHQQIMGFTVWPEDDFPRTHTLKVKKREVLEYVQQAGDAAQAATNQAPTAPLQSPLLRMLHELSPADASEILPESTLGGDLSLDSLSRVELLSAIEQELGVYVDDAAVGPDTTVAELERLVAAAPAGASASTLVTWPLHPLIRVIRELAQQLILFPAYHLLYQVQVTGREYLDGLPQPVLIAANHNFGAGTFGLDPPAAWMGLPRWLRLRICTAGAEDDVFGPPAMAFTAWLFANAFPLAREGNVRGSLEYIGRLLDRGWSVLIFPEGKLTVGGPMQPFMPGTGLMAVESGTPVVPMKIEVHRNSILQGSGWPWRGAFTVHLGKPLIFPPGTPYTEATKQIEAAVRAL